MASAQHNHTRRVLGDLGVNKSLTPSKLTSPQTAKKATLLDAPEIPITYSPRKKRSIDEVDGAVVEEWRPGMIRDFMRRRQAERERAQLNAKDVDADPSDDDDDMSSESAVNDDDVEPSIEDAASRELPATSSQSAIQNSQSSFVDLSQEDKEMLEADEVATLPSSPPSPQNTHHNSRAELLRLRLRVAMFKVQTNQIDVPLSRLQISPQKRSPTSLRENTPLSTMPQHSSTSQISETRAAPRLLPAPVLEPTAYSARRISAYHVPSSPPSSTGTIARMEVDEGQTRVTTPVTTKSRPAQSPMQLSSPPASQEREHRIISKSEIKNTPMKSVVEAKVASATVNPMGTV
ncbi:MAG: hypothetical protein M1835_004324 [Candelina submexicana]|nr:MAG: hypothetical protein M1835_004324 [Candelina submexicana]